MALQYLAAKISIIPRLYQPAYDAVFSTLPFSQRWRLLLLHPINILAALLTSSTWLLNNRYSVLYIPTRSGKKRCLVFQPPASRSSRAGDERGEAEKRETELRPIHIDIHGGGFIGGLAEQDARWCSYLSDKTGAVVVSCTYRVAPRYTFPAAHDDIDDIVSWILSHSKSTLNADPNLLTIGGASAGGSLALSASMTLYHSAHTTSSTASSSVGIIPKALVGFCTPVDYRLKPEEKPRPPNFPKSDPFRFLLPLYDAYAGPDRKANLTNPRLNPIVADKEMLPKDMFFVIAGIDILAHEQLTFVERVKVELEKEGDQERRIEAKVWDRGFHGWLECKLLTS